MKVEVYISELLYRHDCVIVPGIGGFIANYRSAQIHPVTHTFYPPSKSISFNVQLQNNDGLLVNYVAESASISYASAQKKVELFAKKIQNDLLHKKECKLPEIGILSQDAEGKLSFEPKFKVNYLLDAFGLEKVQSPAILRKSKVISLPKAAQKASEEASKKTGFNWRVAAVVLPLIGLSAFVSLEKNLSDEVYASYAYLNPLKKKPAAVYTPRFVEEAVSISIESVEKPVLAKPVESIKEAPAPAVAVASPERFHLIAGCFSSEENAKNLVQSLTSEGFKSSVIGQNEKGLYRVCFQSYSTRELAVVAMEKLKNSGKSTWLLKQ